MNTQEFERYIQSLPKEYTISEPVFWVLVEEDTFSYSIEFDSFSVYVCENTLTYWDGFGGFVLPHIEVVKSSSGFIINYPNGSLTIKL